MIIENVLAHLYDTGDNLLPINDRYSILFMPSDNADVCSIGIYPYRLFPSVFTLMSNADLEKSGIGSVQRNPTLALFGRGVLVGILDSGIDYQHPAFRYADQTSRIDSIWDQTIQAGNPPNGFTYGTRYDREQINQALLSKEPLTVVPTTDEIGHGTAIASIVAGSANPETNFYGILPQSELVVVKLKKPKENVRKVFLIPDDVICYQETDIMLGIRYLLAEATTLRKPLVLCIAFGTSQGAHDSLGATSSYLVNIAQMAQTGVCVAAGNEGVNKRHFYGVASAENFEKEFELKVGEQDKAFSFEIWCDSLSRFSIEVFSPTGEVIPEIFPRLSTCEKYTFIYESSIIWINNNALEEQTGDQMILIRMENTMAGVWRFRMRNIENVVSSFHAWLPSGNLISDETYFLESDPDTTLTSPGNAINPLTIVGYNQINDSILPISGRGYNRVGRITPNLAAPGFNLPCARSGGGYETITGTGAATAYASGIVGMVLEWAVVRGNYTSITGLDINRLLVKGSDREKEVEYPNNIWGYGKINVEGLFQSLRL